MIFPRNDFCCQPIRNFTSRIFRQMYKLNKNYEFWFLFQIDPKKIKTFDDFPLSDLTKKALKEFGYEEPTEIQRETLALGLRGLDILGN